MSRRPSSPWSAGSQGRADLLVARGPQVEGAGGIDELLLVQRMVTPQQHEPDLGAHGVDQRLDLPIGRGAAVHGGEILDRAHTGRREALRRGEARPVGHGGQRRGRLLEVRGVAAAGARGHEVLARVRRLHELDRLLAAHGARGGLHRQGVEAETAEDLAVGVEVEAEGAVEARLVQVERVGVLHHELAHAQQARLRARLVAELALELVPGLGELPVGAQLAGEMGEDLLVGHAQAQLGAAPVLQAEELLAHQLPAAAALPDLRRVQAGQLELLGPDGVHLLADHFADLAADALAQRQERVAPRHELADQARAHQELVARGLGVGRIVAQRGDEGLGPAQARTPPWSALA
jgi:hypothetical protein